MSSAHQPRAPGGQWREVGWEATAKEQTRVSRPRTRRTPPSGCGSGLSWRGRCARKGASRLSGPRRSLPGAPGLGASGSRARARGKAVSPAPVPDAPPVPTFQTPVPASLRWGLPASRAAPPLGPDSGFRVQTGLHSSEDARSGLIKASEINNRGNPGRRPAIPASATRGAGGPGRRPLLTSPLPRAPSPRGRRAAGRAPPCSAAQPPPASPAPAGRAPRAPRRSRCPGGGQLPGWRGGCQLRTGQGRRQERCASREALLLGVVIDRDKQR